MFGLVLCFCVLFIFVCVFSLFCECGCYVTVSTNAISCLQRLISKKNGYVSSGTLYFIHSFTLQCIELHIYPTIWYAFSNSIMLYQQHVHSSVWELTCWMYSPIHLWSIGTVLPAGVTDVTNDLCTYSSLFLACNSRLCTPYVDIILYRGRFWAKSAASGSVRWWCFRSCWMVLSHVMWGRPSCLLQSAGGEANRILLAFALSSMRIICPNKVSRHDWITY